MKKSTDYRELFRANGKRICEMHARIHETLRNRDTAEGRKAWQQACAAFHAEYDALAFPGGYASGVVRLRENDPDAIEASLVFLEERPYFVRSGYMRAKLMRAIKHVKLSGPQTKRLEAVREAEREWRAQRAARTATRRDAP
ncbi:MAG: hypothetical protein K8S99_14780 [Planctomycetes bacterium]|nr:hypothetical protein [Planctomycetota bacterium]